jgi:hypothetical protein
MNFDTNTLLILAGVFAAVILPRLGALGPIVASILAMFKIKPVDPTPNPSNPLDLTSLAAQIAKLLADLLLPQIKQEVQKQFQAVATSGTVLDVPTGVSVVQSSEGTTVTAPGFDVKVTK